MRTGLEWNVEQIVKRLTCLFFLYSFFRGERESVTTCSSRNSALSCKSGYFANTTGRWVSSILSSILHFFFFAICRPTSIFMFTNAVDERVNRLDMNRMLFSETSLDFFNLFDLVLLCPLKFILVINFPGSGEQNVPHFWDRLQKARDQLRSR